MTNQEIFGNNIMYLRQKNAITQQKLADEIGLTRKQLSDYENGKVKRMSNDVVRDISIYFGVSRSVIDTVSLSERGGDNGNGTNI